MKGSENMTMGRVLMLLSLASPGTLSATILKFLRLDAVRRKRRIRTPMITCNISSITATKSSVRNQP